MMEQDNLSWQPPSRRSGGLSTVQPFTEVSHGYDHAELCALSILSDIIKVPASLNMKEAIFERVSLCSLAPLCATLPWMPVRRRQGGSSHLEASEPHRDRH